MKIFFVIDKVEGLQQKIDLLNKLFEAEFDFFVSTKNYLKVSKNKFVVDNLAGVFGINENIKIDEYIKTEKFKADNTLVYYSSAELSYETLKALKEKTDYGYEAVYLKKKSNKLMDFFKNVYKKIIFWMFRDEDALGYVKVEYISKELMELLVKSKFNNRILKIQKCSYLEIEQETEVKSLKSKFKYAKYNIINMIVFVLVLAVYIVLANLFNLMFWLHFMFVMFMLLSVAMAIMLVVNNIFANRYGK